MNNNDRDTSTQTSNLPLTGERTIPDVELENYWFRRHEIAYLFAQNYVKNHNVLEAGIGEGYGADILAHVAEKVVGIDYDSSVVEHITKKYPHIETIQGNLVGLPFPPNSFDTIVNFQVIEHLWDQAEFIRQSFRVLKPGGQLIISTPNRVTFSPGRDIPINPYHTRELNSTELIDLLNSGGFEVADFLGVYHGKGIKEAEHKLGEGIIAAQEKYALPGLPWPTELINVIAEVKAYDFDILSGSVDNSNIDQSLDLLAIARKP